MLKTELGRLRKANRQLEESITLKDEDDKLLEQMFAYLSHKRLNPYDFETVRADLLGMALEAKQRKQPLHELIGDDYTFCGGLLANCNRSRSAAVLTDCLALLFRLTFTIYVFEFIFFNTGHVIFLGQPFTFNITARFLFTLAILYVTFELLMGKIIPLPYRAYRYTPVLSLLVYVAVIVILQNTFQFKQLLYPIVLFTVNGFANVAVMALLGLGWWGLRYAADTLAYKQSSFGQKNGSGF